MESEEAVQRGVTNGVVPRIPTARSGPMNGIAEKMLTITWRPRTTSALRKQITEERFGHQRQG